MAFKRARALTMAIARSSDGKGGGGIIIGGY